MSRDIPQCSEANAGGSPRTSVLCKLYWKVKGQSGLYNKTLTVIIVIIIKKAIILFLTILSRPHHLVFEGSFFHWFICSSSNHSLLLYLGHIHLIYLPQSRQQTYISFQRPITPPPSDTLFLVWETENYKVTGEIEFTSRMLTLCQGIYFLKLNFSSFHAVKKRCDM